MPLLEKIDQDMKQAMLAKDADTLSVLRFLKSAVKYAAIEKTSPLSDPETLQVIQKQIKQRRESIQQFSENGRKEMAAKEEKELSILDLLCKAKLATSKSEARRLVKQKGVKIDGRVSRDWKEVVPVVTGMTIQVGKRRFVKINARGKST